jgi:hypothetical protein
MVFKWILKIFVKLSDRKITPLKIYRQTDPRPAGRGISVHPVNGFIVDRNKGSIILLGGDQSVMIKIGRRMVVRIPAIKVKIKILFMDFVQLQLRIELSDLISDIEQIDQFAINVE